MYIMDKYTVLPKPRHLVNPFRKMCEKYFIWSKYAEEAMLACQRDGGHDILMPLLFLQLPAIRGSLAHPASQVFLVDLNCNAVMLHFRGLWHFLCWGAVAAVVEDGV